MIPERRVSASSVVCREGKVLLVRHTYGATKGKYLIPGGFCEEGEMPVEELLASQNVVETTKELIRNLIAPEKQRLRKSSFINKKYNEDTWQLYL